MKTFHRIVKISHKLIGWGHGNCHKYITRVEVENRLYRYLKNQKT